MLRSDRADSAQEVLTSRVFTCDQGRLQGPLTGLQWLFKATTLFLLEGPSSYFFLWEKHVSQPALRRDLHFLQLRNHCFFYTDQTTQGEGGRWGKGRKEEQEKEDKKVTYKCTFFLQVTFTQVISPRQSVFLLFPMYTAFSLIVFFNTFLFLKLP